MNGLRWNRASSQDCYGFSKYLGNNLVLLGRKPSWQILSQKAILKKYAQEQGFRNIQFFVDDGYSGANFNRPDWNRMIELVKDDKVGIIIAKDYCAIIGLNQKDLENQGILA